MNMENKSLINNSSYLKRLNIGDYVFNQTEYNVAIHIFERFKEVYPDTEIQLCDMIIGIGDPKLHFFCYFSLKAGLLNVKFKCQNCASVIDSTDIEDLIDKTIVLFSNGGYKLTKSRHNNTTKIRKRNKQLINSVIGEYDEKYYSDKKTFTCFIDLFTDSERQELEKESNKAINIADRASNRLSNRLHIARLYTLESILYITIDELMKIKYFGKACLSELYTLVVKIANNIEYTDNAQCNTNSSLNILKNTFLNLSHKEYNLLIPKYEEILSNCNFKKEEFPEKSLGWCLCVVDEYKRFDVDLIKELTDEKKIIEDYKENKENFPQIYYDFCNYFEDIIKQTLTDRDQEIIKERLGINQKESTLQDIGCQFGLTRERIRQMVIKDSGKIFKSKYLNNIVNCDNFLNMKLKIVDVGIGAFMIALFKNQRNNLAKFILAKLFNDKNSQGYNMINNYWKRIKN